MIVLLLWPILTLVVLHQLIRDSQNSIHHPVRNQHWQWHWPNTLAQRCKELASWSQRWPNSGLGNKNHVNVIETSISVQHSKVRDITLVKQFYWLKLCQNIIKSSLTRKRDADVLEDEDECPLKKKFVAFTEVDMDWLEHKVSDIKEQLKEIAALHMLGRKNFCSDI